MTLLLCDKPVIKFLSRTVSRNTGLRNEIITGAGGCSSREANLSRLIRNKGHNIYDEPGPEDRAVRPENHLTAAPHINGRATSLVNCKGSSCPGSGSVAIPSHAFLWRDGSQLFLIAWKSELWYLEPMPKKAALLQIYILIRHSQLPKD